MATALQGSTSNCTTSLYLSECVKSNVLFLCPFHISKGYNSMLKNGINPLKSCRKNAKKYFLKGVNIMAMRNPNGYGTVKRLSGKRRRPYAVYVTVGFEVVPSVPKIDFLSEFLPQEVYLNVDEYYKAYIASLKPKSRQVQKCIGYYETRQDAMVALAEYNKNPYELDKRNTTFRQVYDILHETTFSKMKRSSKNAYEIAMKKCTAIESIRMFEMRKIHMQKIMDDNKDKSKSTLNNLLILFRAIYKFALENDICEKDYSQFVTMESEATKKEKKIFTKEEIQLLWDNIDFAIDPESINGTFKRSRLVDLVLIQIYTGVRPSELLGIRKEDIHLQERWIDLNGTKTTSAKRIIPVHKKIVPLLEERLKVNNEYICVDSDNRKIAYPRYIMSFFTPMCEKLGIDHTPHECRHTFISYANESGMNKTYLKKIIGHVSRDITDDIYTHATIDKLVAEIDKLDL